jgi:hypothetical protein
VVRGVWAHCARGEAFEIITDATVTDCFATGGATGFTGSFSEQRITKGQNILFANCAALVSSNAEARVVRAMHGEGPAPRYLDQLRCEDPVE